MSKPIFMNYWIGQIPPGGIPLDVMPPYVEIAPLAFVDVTDDFDLDFKFLTQTFTKDQIVGAIKKIQANGTKVLFSIMVHAVPPEQQQTFAANVAKHIADWGVDGVDWDIEPPEEDWIQQATQVTKILKTQLSPETLFTAPIYGPWLGFDKTIVSDFANCMNYISTMDYTGYPGYDQTISNCEGYAAIVGWSKLLIGVSCMDVTNDNHTPIEDVKQLTAYQPQSGGPKGGMMLYTFDYDNQSRTMCETGEWTNAIHQGLT